MNQLPNGSGPATTTIMGRDLDQELSAEDTLPYDDTHSTTSSTLSRSSSFRSLMAAYVRPFDKDRDAGNRPLDHYKSKLGPLRNSWRNAILPLIRWETPILADIQQRCRSPFLDIYFALTANLGTHTCYVIMLPLSFWYGHSHLGRSMVFCLAFGVYFTNFLKDLLCLPRPLSPPLHRLTMSGSAALEYGFPSTHTANSVSLSLIVAEWVYKSKDSFESESTYYLYQGLIVLYLVSIVLGRVYCGMHGFLDVIGGLLIGAGLWWFRFTYASVMDGIILNASSYQVLWVIPIVIILIRIHPEPADDCPCFDDGVAFLGVVAGTVVGEWHFSTTKYSNVPAFNNSISFDFKETGVLGFLFRFLVGSILISIWRPVMKRTLYEILPPVFRIIEKVGLSMPRRFFTPASQYGDIPQSLPDSTLFDPQNITKIFTKSGRARADSVGPQSTADVYESIAYREYQKEKQEKQEQAAALTHRRTKQTGTDEKAQLHAHSSGTTSLSPFNAKSLGDSHQAEDSSACVLDDEETMKHGHSAGHHHNCSHSTAEQDAADKDLMSSIVVPRVRYDVEVVTKLIVYAGIGAIATDGAGLAFGILGI